LASALILAPGILLTGAKLDIPLAAGSFLANSNLIDDKLDSKLFSKSFVLAHHNLRHMLTSSAVDCLIESRLVEQRMCSHPVTKETRRISATL
jgi:hypothetical protein